MNTTTNSNADLRTKIREMKSQTVSNQRGQLVFPVIAAREHSVWREELLWLPGGRICYTVLASLLLERGERSEDWTKTLKKCDMHDMEQEAQFLRWLTEIDAISLDLAVYLLVAAHSVANSSGHGTLSEVVDQVCKDKEVPERWPAGTKEVSQRLFEIEEKLCSESPFHIAALLRTDGEYRKLALLEAETAIAYVGYWTYHEIESFLGVPPDFLSEALARGQEELNMHVQRERKAIIASFSAPAASCSLA